VFDKLSKNRMPTLVKFTGKPKQLSPKARMKNWIGFSDIDSTFFFCEK